MAGSLDQYWKKRDFGATPEPKGEVARAGKALSFVIQKHAATRLHYDFRLELEGTLVSWAIPKGPSLDPKVRRMAVHVEDHPLSYATFEGVIPKGHYGAGTVEVWDRGTWVPIEEPREGLRKGRLKFELHGEKLHGRWTLVRIEKTKGERQEVWLLIKEEDDEARPAAEYDITEALPESVMGNGKAAKKMKKKDSPKTQAKAAPSGIPEQAVPAKLPLSLFPQLATLVDAPPADEDGWIYEVKFDGYRVLARIDGDDVRLFTRNGNDWTSRMKSLRDEIAKLGIASGWIDGEIVVMNSRGLPDFQSLQGAFDSSKTKDIVYFAFDLPYFGGYDLRRVPLLQRRELLRSVFESRATPSVRFSDHFEGPAQPLLDGACRQGLEGLIGKRRDAPYSSSRSSSWIKLKCTRRQEFVIVGYTDPKGSRTGFGSLLLGYNDEQGRLHYAGNVGTGFDDNSLRSLTAQLKKLDTQKPPVAEVPRGVKGHWVKPKLVAEVAFTEWTSEGRIRHPVFHGLRTDKDPQAITRERVVDVPDDGEAAAKKSTRAGKKPAGAAATKATAAAATKKTAGAAAKKTAAAVAKNTATPTGGEVAGIKVTHAERVIDPSTGATKGDLVAYYERVAEDMLPHLVGRPIALVRAPQGITGELFFQKHGDKIKIPGIRQLDRSFWPGHPAMLEIASKETLVGAAQMNVIEFHTWNSTIDAIDKPDRFILDLDPGEGITWKQLVEATRLTRQMLDMLELKSFLKTSGGKGLHIVVPIKPKWGYDEVKAFSEKIVVHLARTIPQLFVAKSGPQNRIGRIFVDYLRNGPGATTVAAFSARARPGLGVSVPVHWSELGKLKGADQWNIFTLPARLAKLRADPWQDYGKVKQTLEKAAKLLDA
jgi:bifunctional non-homologous end joining protein LigD